MRGGWWCAIAVSPLLLCVTDGGGQGLGAWGSSPCWCCEVKTRGGQGVSEEGCGDLEIVILSCVGVLI